MVRMRESVQVKENLLVPQIVRSQVGALQVFIDDDGSGIHATPRSRKIFYE